MPEILFICTANYYRSRFAEAIFNDRAAKRGLGWSAFSRGFTPEEAPEGMSPHAINGLKLAGVDPQYIPTEKNKLAEEDFERAEHVIALKREEHEPMIRKRFPAHAGRVEYWDIDDVPLISPPQALLAILENVERLIENLGEPE